MVFVSPEDTWYKEMTPEVAEKLVLEHLVEKQVLQEHLFFMPEKQD
jgi:(2Fe-2S) ferredoxin